MVIKEFPIIKFRWLFLAVSGVLIVSSIVALVIWGLHFGVEFTGGSLMNVNFEERVPTREEIISKLSDQDLGDIAIQNADEKNLILRFKAVDENKHQEILNKIKEIAPAQEEQFTSIGPVIGSELKQKAAWAIGLAIVGIMIYIAWAFRRVSKPVSSWQYGFIVALVALLHDVIIPLGVFSAFGYYMGIEINVAFIAAILTILGFSVHDSIVVFDRTRENLRRIFDKSFAEIVNTSLNQTLGRSLATSTTVLLTIAAIAVFAGPAVFDFALALFIGIAIGTYSSIFVAGPLLIEFQKISSNFNSLKRGKRRK